MARKKSDRKPKNIGQAGGFQNIISNEKADFLFGIILLIISVYTIMAMVSYFTTGQADQSILEDMRPGEWINTDKAFTNYCGSFGAIIAYYLITVNFGLSAVMIPIFMILSALQLMKVYRINLLSWFFGTMLVMIWTSVTFAKFLTPVMGNLVFNPGGNHGLFCVQQLENLIGPPGLTGVLLFVALAFLTYISAETINVIRKALNPVKFLTSKVHLTITNMQPRQESSAQEEGDTAEILLGNDSDEASFSQEKKDEIENLVNDTKLDDIPVDVPSPIVDLSNIVMDAPQKRSTPTTSQEHLIKSGNESELIVAAAPSEEVANEKTIEEILKTPINPLEPFTKYKKPTLNLLKKYNDSDSPVIDMEEIKANNQRIIEVLNSFGVSISKINATVGPTITLYEITPAEGVRVSKIRGLEDDIALNLSALGIRIIAPIPGKGTIGIEVPNKKPQIVSIE